MRIGLVVPHIFMQDSLLDSVIFSPGTLAKDLAQELESQEHSVTLFSPGSVLFSGKNVTADLSYFEHELKLRGDTYIDLLKKHPLTFITLARQVQSELLAKAFVMANNDELDIVHIYTNEEDTALPFSRLCSKPVVFTHHDPFNFLANYRSLFPKYPHLNWLSISKAQRKVMPTETNWVKNIYHGLDTNRFTPNLNPQGNYIAYLGRIIEPKGVHLAVQAIKQFNQQNPTNTVKLKLAGKHYAGKTKNTYWEEQILPQIDDEIIEYVGHIKTDTEIQDFLGNAKALIVPSTFEEPFGMVMIEALACSTPIIGLDSGAIPEVINAQNGILVNKEFDGTTINDASTAANLAQAINKIIDIDRKACRKSFEQHYTLRRMAQEHIEAYEQLLKNN